MMRNAKCLLATRAGGLHGYIDHGVSGFCMDDLAADLPVYIRQLEDEPGRAETMGRAARQRYEQRFSLSIATSAFENVLPLILQRRRPARETKSPHRPLELNRGAFNPSLDSTSSVFNIWSTVSRNFSSSG